MLSSITILFSRNKKHYKLAKSMIRACVMGIENNDGERDIDICISLIKDFLIKFYYVGDKHRKNKIDRLIEYYKDKPSKTKEMICVTIIAFTCYEEFCFIDPISGEQTLTYDETKNKTKEILKIENKRKALKKYVYGYYGKSINNKYSLMRNLWRYLFK